MPIDIEEITSGFQLPAQGFEYLKRVATSPPSRRVRSGGNNVICRHPSKKMGCVIQAESHRHELALIHVLENDPDVHGFWDQPEPIKISYQSAGGRLTSPMITPDFLVLYSDCVEWIEVKSEEALRELAKEMPFRYVLTENKEWRSPPAEVAAKPYGFDFRIWTPEKLNPIWLRNIQFLSDYFDVDAPKVPTEIKEAVLAAVQKDQGLSLFDLRLVCPSASADHLNLLLATDQLYANLNAAPLTDPKHVLVYSCKESAETLDILSKERLAAQSDRREQRGQGF